MIERQRAKRWSTARAWKYRIVPHKLTEYICLTENQTIDISKSVYRQSEVSTSIVQNQDNYIDPFPNLTYTQPQTEEAAVVEKDEVVEEQVAAGKEEVEKQQQATDDQIADVCIQLRRLSPNITINSSVRNAIHSFWHNVPAALARVKSAIAQGWCKQPTGLGVVKK